MRERDLFNLFRSIVLGMSGSALVGCGTAPSSVIPDAGQIIVDAGGPDAGFDAGSFDAGPLMDGGMKMVCSRQPFASFTLPDGGQILYDSGLPEEPLSWCQDTALDNAVEGCGRETFSALVGLYQARHARSAHVRRVLASVSEDEVGHAAWSWEAARQFNRHLRPAVRRRVAEACEQTLTQLAHDYAVSMPRAFRDELGLPDDERLHDLAAAAKDALLRA